MIRNNAKVNLGDKVEVKKAQIKPAQKVVLAPSLDTAKKDYDTMVSTRRRQLEKPLDKIEEITSLVESSETDKLDRGQQKF